ERNNHGLTVLELLRKRYPRIYEMQSKPGFLTNSVTRPEMLAQVASVLIDAPQCFNSRGLLREMRTFIRKANGRAEAAAGMYDDRVMAMAIALFVRAEGRPYKFVISSEA